MWPVARVSATSHEPTMKIRLAILRLSACLLVAGAMVLALVPPASSTPRPSALQEPEGAEDPFPSLRATLDAARAAQSAGEAERARELVASAVEDAVRALAKDDNEASSDLCQELGAFAHDAGELRAAERIRRAVLEQRERTLPAGHPDLLVARGRLAVTMAEMGDLPGARELEEAVLAEYERTLPGDHPDLLRARGNLAVTMREMGDLPGARALEEAVLHARERTLPADDPDLLRARQSLAITVFQMGDYQGARSLFEAVLQVRERTLPAGHPSLLAARGN